MPDNPIHNPPASGPNPFGEWSQSMSQCFYYMITSHLGIEDWIGAFTPSGVLVGAKQVHPSNSMTDIPAMGNDTFWYSEEYMTHGEIPTFKIYHASSGAIFDAEVENPAGWVGNGTLVVGIINTSTPISIIPTYPARLNRRGNRIPGSRRGGGGS